MYEETGVKTFPLFRSSGTGYEVTLKISDWYESVSGSKQFGDAALTVTIYALERIGALTEENVKNVEMLAMLRKLAALPGNG